jgi:NAD(P)-dependent dehydrogenase (short-subunit alcohol dehydrogenase family)
MVTPPGEICSHGPLRSPSLPDAWRRTEAAANAGTGAAVCPYAGSDTAIATNTVALIVTAIRRASGLAGCVANVPDTIRVMSRNDSPVLIVTGASAGIGAATARLAATRGYSVCVNFLRNCDAAAEVVAAIERDGGRAIAVQADVSSEPEVVQLFETVASRLGPVTALVNNAATLERQMRLEDMDAARFQRIFATNVFGSLLCAREAVRRMSTRRGGAGGSIVNVSSGASRWGSPGEYIDYAASKGAIDTFTTGLAKEVAEEGIRVNGVRPGFIYTGMHAKGGEPQRVDRVKTLVPMQRGGLPEEVAAAILWLLSEEASYITGTMIDVSGGR